MEIEDGAATQASQFVALSKVLDATELGLLVRIHMDRLEEVEVPADFHSRGAAGPADVPSQGAATAAAVRAPAAEPGRVQQPSCFAFLVSALCGRAG